MDLNTYRAFVLFMGSLVYLLYLEIHVFLRFITHDASQVSAEDAHVAARRKKLAILP